MKPGGVFAGYDGAKEWILKYEGAGRDDVRVSVESERLLPETPGGRVTIAPAIIKGRRWDWIIEKATELGAGVIAPVIAGRSVVKITDRDTDEKMVRWRRIAGAACAQCAGRAPEIRRPLSLEEFIEKSRGLPGRFVMMKTAGAEPFCKLTAGSRAGEKILLVGPEGDWTEEEAEMIVASGFQPATLGETILRSETAAIAATLLAVCGGGGDYDNKEN